MKKEFETVLTSRGPGGAWTFMPIPFSVEEVFGSKGRVAVCGMINGFPFRNSIMPEGDGTHAMMFSKELQAGAKAKAGNRVRVVMERDEGVREVAVPPELQAALKKHKQAGAFFAGLTAAQKKEYADWVAGAKQQATKDSRAAKAVELLAAGNKRLK
jgi:hypothetical protein